MKKASFIRKPHRANIEPQDTYKIVRTINLQKHEFEFFMNNLLRDTDFIEEHSREMYRDENNVWHVLFVTSDAVDYGVLVNSEGYSYARYAAYVKKSEVGGK